MLLRRAFVAFVSALAMTACAPVETPAAEAPATITLERGVCFGFCPAYRVSVTSEGEVTYVGERFVAVQGEQHATIPREQAAQLFARLDQIGFTRLREEYRASVTDLPTYTVTLRRNGQTKRIVDYGGLSAGMPESVRALQNEIDRVANTGRWVLRDGEPVRNPGPEH